jgi:hypothetical protein
MFRMSRTVTILDDVYDVQPTGPSPSSKQNGHMKLLVLNAGRTNHLL